VKNIPLIDLKPTHRKMEKAILGAIRDAYRRNDFILGEDVKALEKDMAELCGVAHGIGMSSGTSALEGALRALGIGPGDEVITTPFTFFATAAVIAYTGATPVFVDVEPGTLNMDMFKLEAACSPRTKAIVPVHLFGNPMNMSSVMKFAEHRSLFVVEDACQAHGAVHRDRPVGGWGHAGCFSFYPSKNVGGLGDGGMVVTHDSDLAEKIRLWRNCGRRAQYEHVALGRNERLDNVQAAVLRVKLKHLTAWNKERDILADLYHRELKETPVRPLEVRENSRPVYHLYTVRAPRRDELQKHLNGRGIGAGVFYPLPLHLQKAFAGLGHKAGDFPVAEAASREVLSLPLYPGLSWTSVRRVIAAVREFYAS
jgi:dTDP-4-amino-4,6-dideoxygalactose transaminase